MTRAFCFVAIHWPRAHVACLELIVYEQINVCAIQLPRYCSRHESGAETVTLWSQDDYSLWSPVTSLRKHFGSYKRSILRLDGTEQMILSRAVTCIGIVLCLLLMIKRFWIISTIYVSADCNFAQLARQAHVTAAVRSQLLEISAAGWIMPFVMRSSRDRTLVKACFVCLQVCMAAGIMKTGGCTVSLPSSCKNTLNALVSDESFETFRCICNSVTES